VRYEKAGRRRRGFIGVSRDSLRALWGDKCYICYRTMKFHPRDHDDPLYATLEHIVPRAAGGAKTWDNIKLSCRECNNEKKSMFLEDYLQAYAEQIDKRRAEAYSDDKKGPVV
jgi:5-methylcytosine-specific restriction endonuclease McrA